MTSLDALLFALSGVCVCVCEGARFNLPQKCKQMHVHISNCTALSRYPQLWKAFQSVRLVSISHAQSYNPNTLLISPSGYPTDIS